jgi:ABC-type tungstate transport system substrate-binding protein
MIEVLLGTGYGAATGAVFAVLTAALAIVTGGDAALAGAVGLTAVMAMAAIPVWAVFGTVIGLLIQPFRERSARVVYAVAVGATVLASVVIWIPLVTASGNVEFMWWAVLAVAVSVGGVVAYVRSVRRRHDRLVG